MEKYDSKKEGDVFELLIQWLPRILLQIDNTGIDNTSSMARSALI